MENILTSFSNYRRSFPADVFFSFSFLAIPWHIEFRGQGSDLSHSCDLSFSYGNAGSLTLCTGLGIKLVSQRSRDAADPLVPQRELPT